MAEAACVLHAFTFPSFEPNQGVGMGVLHQESVTFGRFATEALAWDRWSSFSNKRYVEEAVKHSQPGLVAKKKAFFEAYYKKKALLDQENAEDGNYTQELENVTYPNSDTLVSEAPAIVGKQDAAETLEAKLKSKSLNAEEMEVISCTKENVAILKDVKINPEDSEISAGKLLPICPQPPVIPRASSKRVYSVKGHITSNTDGLPPLKNVQESLNLEASVEESAEANRIKTMLKSPASKSRRNKTDLCQFSKTSYACTESNSPIISSPFGFGTGKGTQKYREKLEEILNNKTSKRVKFQIRIKEKAASYLKKLRLGFCFCSKPSPENSHQSQELQKQISVECIQLEKRRHWKHVEKHQS